MVQERLKKLALIANRNAGKGKVLQAIKDARRHLWGWTLEVFWPSSIQELRELCLRLDPALYEAAVILGGDGTLNQFLRGMVNQSVPLCVYPIGTANDFARELGIATDWNQIQNLLDHRRVESIDLLEVNGIPFLTVAGIGVGALLTEEFNRGRARSRLFREVGKRLQSQVYSALAVKTILFRKSYSHRIHIRSNVLDEKFKAAAVFICNQNKLAGNLRVALSNDNRDEMFSVLVVPDAHPLKLITTLLRFKQGTLSPMDCILFSTQQVSIRDLEGHQLQVFGDGETLIEAENLDFKLLPKALRVFRGGVRS